MARSLSFKKVNDFFKDLATKHVDINDFVGTSPVEFSEKASTVDGLKTTLVFYDYRGKLSGNDQRTFNNRTLSFSIIKPGIQSDDFLAQDLAIDECEAIGLEVLSRINVWSKMPESGWLYKNFEKETVIMEEVRAEEGDSFWGMDFSFELKTLEPLVVDPSRWSDGGIFCTT